MRERDDCDRRVERDLARIAEATARVTLTAAQQRAEETERDTLPRHQTLPRVAKLVEERRQRVLESLRDLAAQLQDALVEPAEMARQDESLVDALPGAPQGARRQPSREP